MIVEDEERVSAVLQARLLDNGFPSEIASDGNQAVELAQSGRFYLIILDINLPLINGFDVCRKIRESNQNIPILMLTALNAGNSKMKGFQVGADDYLAKPFDFDELLAKIRVFFKAIAGSERKKPYA